MRLSPIKAPVPLILAIALTSCNRHQIRGEEIHVAMTDHELRVTLSSNPITWLEITSGEVITYKDARTESDWKGMRVREQKFAAGHKPITIRWNRSTQQSIYVNGVEYKYSAAPIKVTLDN